MFTGLFGSKKNALDIVEAALNARDWKFARVADHAIVTGFKAGAAAVVIQIRNEPGKRALLVMGNILNGALSPMTAMQSGALPLLCVHPNAGHSAQQVARACEQLLAMNYELAVGAFERDPSDGEIRFRIGLPYRDAQPTQEQIEWCLAVTADATSRVQRELGDMAGAGKGMEI